MKRFLVFFLCAHSVSGVNGADSVFPGATWETRTPEQVGLSQDELDALKELVGGRGCVVRHGYMVYSWGDQTKSSDVASAFKPVLSTLLFFAIQEGRLKSVDDFVAEFEPRLKTLNNGKDATITWRHLASQTSGYGLAETPGAAYSYNDFALALYYDALTGKIFGTDGSAIFKTRLAGPLQFEDAFTFDAFGRSDRAGRLAVSVRDFARFGLLYLRNGKWQDRELIKPEFIRMALNSPIPADTPLTSGREADMLPGQRSVGGTRNITRVGPGFYSFNWWLNRANRRGQQLFVDAPPDICVASGHGGKRTLWILPSLDLIVCWNDSPIADHDQSPGNPNTKCNQAARLIVGAARGSVPLAAGRSEAPAGATGPPAANGGTTKVDANGSRKAKLSIRDGKWHLNGEITYRGSRSEGLLMNARMVNAVFEDLKRPEFDAEANANEFIAQISDYVANGVRAFTVNLQGGFPGYEGAVNSAFNPDGSLRDAYMNRVRRVVEACDRNGAAVILGCFYQRQDQLLRNDDAVRSGVSNVVDWIVSNGFPNVALEISNEFDHGGFDHRLLKTAEGQVELMQLAKQLAPGLLVSTSGLGHGRIPDAVAQVGDFILIHFNGTPLEKIPERIAALKEFNKPLVCNEDDKPGADGAEAARLCVAGGASWGLMLSGLNQHFPFTFNGAVDDPLIYRTLKELTSRPAQ